jgi:hypothetical protein
MEENSRRFYEMRKYFVGLIAGIVLSFTVSTQAAEIQSLIGRAVEGEFPVKVKGQKIENPAIVIDGTSYLPVRAIGDALNLAVSFNADLGIELTEKMEASVMSTPIPKWTTGERVESPQATPPPRVTKTPMTKESFEVGLRALDHIISLSEDNIRVLKVRLEQAVINNKDEDIGIITKSIEGMENALAASKQDKLDFIALYPEYTEQ